MSDNMKLRYFISAFVAVVAMLAGCSDKFEPSYLDTVKVSQSYVTMPEQGGSYDIDLTAKDSWTVTGIPEWLTVSPTQGEKGTYKLNFSVNETTESQSAIVYINCGGKSQQIFVSQEAANAVKPHGQTADDPYTVAEAIARCEAIGATSDGVYYYAKGKITQIAEVSTTYGNATFAISDVGASNALICYRSFYLQNTKFTAEDQIKVGDEVIITGKLVNYKESTPEFSGEVYIYSLNGKTK